MKKLICLIIGIMLVFPMTVNAGFSDVAENHWAISYINELSSNKVINGYPDGTFKPNGTLTKGEFLKLIMTASLPDYRFKLVQTDFEHWASIYLKVAENYGVVDSEEINGSNIDEPISRIDVIKILSLSDTNIKGNPQKAVEILNFNDVNNLPLKDQILLKHAVAKEIIGGYPDGTFKPQNNLTRAEASKILYIYMSK